MSTAVIVHRMGNNAFNDSFEVVFIEGAVESGGGVFEIPLKDISEAEEQIFIRLMYTIFRERLSDAAHLHTVRSIEYAHVCIDVKDAIRKVANQLNRARRALERS
ncbi:hypothetical protein [Thermomonas sp. HDW16]|uniref:hypothetical protein n=1 Tax=Thermomonas sp. HDW16 TaxID=2714945 RepID=UPI00197D6377|nr:hypothetical protein [Thermomonas sp. HDW16]